MNSQILLGIFSAAALIASVYAHPKNSIVHDAIENAREARFDLVGQIGKKMYFRNDTVSNWPAGPSRCGTAGLEYASLRNRDEFAFVRSQLNNRDRLWIGATLRGNAAAPTSIWQAYAWADGSDVSDDINLVSTGQELCLLLSGDDHVFTENCYRGSYGVLCQLVLP